MLSDDKWIDMHTDFSHLGSDENDPEAKKAQDQERCTVLPGDAIAGQAATVYQTHNTDLGIDAKFWISKASHLPIQSQTTTDVGAMTSVAMARYMYGNIQYPQTPSRCRML